MDVRAALLRAGGVARYAELRAILTRTEIRSAVEGGYLIRVGQGRYALSELDADRRAAASLSGALGGLSAAMFWGWKVKFPPDQPQVLVPLGRKVAPPRRSGIEVRWRDLPSDALDRGALGRIDTALDCAKTLPFDVALAVVDSALRDGISKSSLLIACQRTSQKGRARALTVIELADERADNPFESVLRAIVLDVPGATFEPQVWVGNVGRADLVDRERRIVVEADSFEFHSDADAMLRDMERYNGFLAEGYRVLRFGWKHAMFRPDYVRAAVAAAVATNGLQIS